jgi:hypothetical protein
MKFEKLFFEVNEMRSKYQKLINLDPEEKEGLDSIMEEINKKGGVVSAMRLINDAIRIFLKYYGNQAVEKYSRIYEKEMNGRIFDLNDLSVKK